MSMRDKLVMQHDELLPEYEVDYTRAKPNPYAAKLSGNVRTVVLDADVAEGFPDAESVNRALRKLLSNSEASHPTTGS